MKRISQGERVQQVRCFEVMGAVVHDLDEICE
jgi:hypothetical protein